MKASAEDIGLPVDYSSCDWRLSVAPMLDWTDRWCRPFHRLITRRARLYTEMITTGALLHGDWERHLDHEDTDRPLALQLGGCDPDELGSCARLAARRGFDEINLNCGCPSPRVQRGAFGACLMAEPKRVADSVRAMLDAVGTDVPITVKHRLGLGRDESYAFVRDFVGCVADAGCRVFIVHARNAWLEGLSPKDNRDIPPLRHETVHRLKRDFPALTFVVNGGLDSPDAIALQWRSADGAMLGRQAYHEPASMARWDDWLDGDTTPNGAAFDDPGDEWRDGIEAAFVARMAEWQAQGVPWSRAARHMLGLRNGRPGSRAWRRVWSDHRLAGVPVADVAALARAARVQGR